jgi:hypothetical protein
VFLFLHGVTCPAANDAKALLACLRRGGAPPFPMY